MREFGIVPGSYSIAELISFGVYIYFISIVDGLLTKSMLQTCRSPSANALERSILRISWR